MKCIQHEGSSLLISDTAKLNKSISPGMQIVSQGSKLGGVRSPGLLQILLGLPQIYAGSPKMFCSPLLGTNVIQIHIMVSKMAFYTSAISEKIV